METSIIWCLIGTIVAVFASGYIAIKILMRAIEALEDELSSLEELLIENGTLSVEDALGLCEKGV